MTPTPFNAAAGIVNACQALPTVTTGGQPSAQHLRALKDAGAEILLDLRDPMEPRPYDEPALAREVGLEYINVPISSATLNDATLERVLAVYRNAGEKKIFVHCAGGGGSARRSSPISSSILEWRRRTPSSRQCGSD